MKNTASGPVNSGARWNDWPKLGLVTLQQFLFTQRFQIAGIAG